MKWLRSSWPGLETRGAPIRLLAVGLAALAISCGGAPAKPVEAPGEEAAEAPKPKPRNAGILAESIAGGKISVLVYADRTRGHPITTRAAALDLWGPVLEGTGIAPERDLARAFVTAPSARKGNDAVAVLEHTLAPDKVKEGLDALVAKSEPPGAWIDGGGVQAARVTIRGHTRVIAPIEPSFLVILPESKAQDAARFVGTGGFPDPAGPEAVVATAVDPANTLRAQQAPRVPKTVSSLGAKVFLEKDGGAVVEIEGQSASPEQARQDAQELTEAVDAATSIKVAIVKIRVFDPPKFTADGDRIKSKRHITPVEVDRLFGLLSAVVPR